MATTAVAASKTLWPLISLVVVGVGVLGGALHFTRQRWSGQENLQETQETQETIVSPVLATTQVIEPVPAPSVEQPASSSATPSAPDLPAQLALSARRPQDRLAAEVALLSRATRDLRAGRPAEALTALSEYRRKFPKGLLSEEQGAARAQALCALGRFDEANEKLAGLAPRSPLAVQAKQFCDAKYAAR